jgi:transposase
MGNPAGVRRDFEALEQRRFKAFRLLKKGLSEAEVARQVGVHRQSVNRWAQQIERHGREGLKKAGRAGRKSRLSGIDLKKLESRLKQGPQALGYETNLWTLDRVAKLIERDFGVEYHPGHVGWLLGKLGWSC